MMDDNWLDISLFSETCKCMRIGKLTKNMVAFLHEKCPDLSELLVEQDIVLWENRIAYTAKHKLNFRDEDEYYAYLENTPSIIKNPDYIGIPPHDLSIQFIKVFEHNIVVAVRISAKGTLSYRTMYPITDGQLQDYQRKNRAWKYIDRPE